MEKRYNNKSNIYMYLENYKSSDLMYEGGFFIDSLFLRWVCIRKILLKFAFNRGCNFNSTEECILRLFEISELCSIRSKVVFLYTIGTLAEWDESFSVTQNQADYYRFVCDSVLSLLFSLEGDCQHG